MIARAEKSKRRLRHPPPSLDQVVVRRVAFPHGDSGAESRLAGAFSSIARLAGDTNRARSWADRQHLARLGHHPTTG